MQEKIFYKGVAVKQAEYNKKWNTTDTRRQIVAIEFNNGSIWYPRYKDWKFIESKMKEAYNHNKQFPNIDEVSKE